MKPSREYTIKILSDADFDLLPYPKAKSSLGMSVMDDKTAYIRKTGVKELDQNTINHEFDELMQATSPHEENGIRYKAWIPFIVNALMMAAGSAAVESVVTGGITAAKGGKFSEGAKRGAISGGTGGLTAGLGAPALLASGAANAATAATQPNQTSIPGFSNGGQYQPQSSFTPSNTTAAFAPQTQQPLGQDAFNTSLAKLDKNAGLKQQSVMDRFRGRTLEGDTAFNRAYTGAETSSNLERSQFLEDQKKLGSTFV